MPTMASKRAPRAITIAEIERYFRLTDANAKDFKPCQVVDIEAAVARFAEPDPNARRIA